MNEYYLCIPQVLDVRGENQAPKHSGCVVALDPGIITFQSTFDTNGYVSKWGTGDVKRITRLCLVHDKLQSKWTLTNHKKRYKYKKAGRRIQKKIRNLVDDLHKKLCLWLCRNYRAILLPSFETKSLSNKLTRKLGKQSVRNMLSWSHYRFQQRLLHKSREFPWCHVYIVNEAYTSKTCTMCGNIYEVGKSRTYQCPTCGMMLDRDINGARNILLRFLTTHKIPI